jgi:hypothetical protein
VPEGKVTDRTIIVTIDANEADKTKNAFCAKPARKVVFDTEAVAHNRNACVCTEKRLYQFSRLIERSRLECHEHPIKWRPTQQVHSCLSHDYALCRNV